MEWVAHVDLLQPSVLLKLGTSEECSFYSATWYVDDESIFVQWFVGVCSPNWKLATRRCVKWPSFLWAGHKQNLHRFRSFLALSVFPRQAHACSQLLDSLPSIQTTRSKQRRGRKTNRLWHFLSLSLLLLHTTT